MSPYSSSGSINYSDETLFIFTINVGARAATSDGLNANTVSIAATVTSGLLETDELYGASLTLYKTSLFVFTSAATSATTACLKYSFVALFYFEALHSRIVSFYFVFLTLST